MPVEGRITLPIPQPLDNGVFATVEEVACRPSRALPVNGHSRVNMLAYAMKHAPSPWKALDVGRVGLAVNRHDRRGGRS